MVAFRWARAGPSRADGALYIIERVARYFPPLYFYFPRSRARCLCYTRGRRVRSSFFLRACINTQTHTRPTRVRSRLFFTVNNFSPRWSAFSFRRARFQLPRMCTKKRGERERAHRFFIRIYFRACSTSASRHFSSSPSLLPLSRERERINWVYPFRFNGIFVSSVYIRERDREMQSAVIYSYELGDLFFRLFCFYTLALFYSCEDGSLCGGVTHGKINCCGTMMMNGCLIYVLSL